MDSNRCAGGNRVAAAVRAVVWQLTGETTLAQSGLAAACLTLAGTSLAYACPTAVTSSGDPGASGLDLRTAIGLANASSGCVIQFDPSLNGSTITLHSGELSITSPMAIVGPGADKLTISGNNATRIFSVKPPAVTTVPVTFSGLTLTDGLTGFGAAIYALNSPIVVESSVMTNSVASGGAIISVSDAAYARLDNVDLHSNKSTAVVFLATPATISNSKITGNMGHGVVVLASPSAEQLLIQNSIISGNTTTATGGGTYVNNGFLRVVNSTITGNAASVGGGGVSLHNATGARFTDVQITNNSTNGDGGGILVTGSASLGVDLQIVQSSISHNFAYDFGAGIDVKSAFDVAIAQSLISGNQLTDFTTGANGGGIALQYVQSATRIDNSTIYGNFAYNSGGGIGIFDAATGNRTQITQTTISHNGTYDTTGTSNGIFGSGTPVLFSCIVANNISSHGTSAQDLSGSFSTTYTLIKNKGGATITNHGGLITGVDPQLGLLSVNGGPTMTMLPAPLSPVINAGGNPSSITLTGMDRAFDQRGLLRPSTVADMGAVQREHPEDIIFRNGFD